MFATDRHQSRTALASFGVTQPWRVRYGPLSFVLIVVLAAVAGCLAVEHYHPSKDINGANASTAIVGLGAFLIGYHQWRSAKQETSLERYYDRLKLANDARNCLSEADHKIPPMLMYTYIELDNLEYVYQKYRLGYMAPEHALRGVNTFKSRLEGVRGFNDALKSLGDDISATAGYHRETSVLVRRLRDTHAAKPVA